METAREYQALIDAKRILQRAWEECETSWASQRMLSAQRYIDKQASEIARRMCEPEGAIQ